MIKHIVLFKLKDATSAAINEAVAVLLSMKGKTPQILDIEVGADFLRSERSYDVALQVTVANREALDAYQLDAYHCSTVKPYMHEKRLSSVAVDYEI
ncbi:MAG: Dabb family protein [Christensenellaceae bacterium]|jgi:hypothetical protein|nr:Dabb family protein [Christensenellaceae bacterium]